MFEPADGEFDAAEIDRELISARLKQDVLEHSGKNTSLHRRFRACILYYNFIRFTNVFVQSLTFLNLPRLYFAPKRPSLPLHVLWQLNPANISSRQKRMAALPNGT